MDRQCESTKKNKGAIAAIIVLIVVLCLFLSLNIFGLFTAFTAKAGGGVPGFFGFKPFAIQSDSMAPFFNKGDLIISKDCDTKELKVGDVITFWTVIQGQKALNTHRIVAVTDNDTFRTFTTKGDNNAIEDGMAVHESEVVGKYVTRIPGFGTAIDFLQTSGGFLLFSVVSFILLGGCIAILVILIVKTSRKKRTDKMIKEEKCKKNSEISKKSYCTMCGTRLESGTLFCPKCGQKQ